MSVKVVDGKTIVTFTINGQTYQIVQTDGPIDPKPDDKIELIPVEHWNIRDNKKPSDFPIENVKKYDEDENTRYSALGPSVLVELKTKTKAIPIKAIEIEGWKEAERDLQYTVAFRADTGEFVEFTQSRKDLGKIHSYEFDKPVALRYIRIMASGNNQNQWVSIQNIKLYGIVQQGINVDEDFDGNVVTPPPQCGPNERWDDVQKKCVPIDNPPPPKGFTKDGVQLLYADGSNVRYDDYRKNFRDDGKRFDYDCGKTFLNCELIGYFKVDDEVDDEVSGKMRGGKHSNGSVPKTYDMGVDILGKKKCRFRTEEKHPEYEKGGEGQVGISCVGKYVGYRFVCKNEDNGVRLIIEQDQGDNEGDKPANKWVRIGEWLETKKNWRTVADDHQETVRIDGPNGVPSLKWKWLSLAEIKDGGTVNQTITQEATQT